MEKPIEWFRRLSKRERMLIKGAAFLVVLVGGPLWAWSAAKTFRDGAARDLAAAIALQQDQARLAGLQKSTPTQAPIASDGTPRGLALALATQTGLKVARIEADGPQGFAAAFEAASAIAVYRWIDGMERAGVTITSVTMTRAGEGDIVTTLVRAASGVR